MHRLLHIRLLLTLMMTQEKTPVDTSGQVRLNCLVWEGGVEFIAFLLNKAVPMASDQLVFYKNIARLPSQLWEQWKKACQEELEALCKCKVFELADLPKGRKAINVMEWH